MKKLLKTIKKKLLAAPIFLTVSFVLSIYLHNITVLSLEALKIPLIVALIFSIALSVIFIFIKDRTKRELFACLFVLLFFSYGGVVYILSSLGWTTSGWDSLIFPLWLGLIILSFFLLKRSQLNLKPLNKFFLLMSIFAVIMPLLGIGKYELTQRWPYAPAQSPLTLPTVDQANFKHGLPDIYYIVPDSYASPEIFKKYLAVDQSDFIKNLQQQGFYIPAQNTSNYPKTTVSIASTLNMEYLDYLANHKNSSDQTVVMPLINNNNVKKFLGKLGYKYYQLGAWWVTDYNPEADKNFTLTGTIASLNLFNNSILQSTLLRPLILYTAPGKIVANSDTDVKNQNEYQFTELPEIAKMSGPKFVFAHILSPHLPYIYGQNCEPVTKAELAKNTEAKNYANQASCTSLKLEQTVTKIISNSKTPPIILIQSDEGVPYIRYKLPSEDDWQAATSSQLQEKFPVLAAYYLPGIDGANIGSTTSNVNAFRKIFNLYFSASFPILLDKNYIFPNLSNLYEFKNITASLK